jgi:hypothetical protein
MDLVKIKKVVQKNFKDFDVKSSLDEETLIVLICADLIREDMSGDAPAPARSTNRSRGNNVPGDSNAQQ